MDDTHQEIQQNMFEVAEKTVPISVNVGLSVYQFKHRTRVSWNYLLTQGMHSLTTGRTVEDELRKKIEKMSEQLDKHVKRINELERPAKLKAMGLGGI